LDASLGSKPGARRATSDRSAANACTGHPAKESNRMEVRVMEKRLVRIFIKILREEAYKKSEPF
jgi:hypothetical protein